MRSENGLWPITDPASFDSSLDNLKSAIKTKMEFHTLCGFVSREATDHGLRENIPADLKKNKFKDYPKLGDYYMESSAMRSGNI